MSLIQSLTSEIESILLDREISCFYGQKIHYPSQNPTIRS